MTKTIPIAAAKRLAEEFDLRQVIIAAWDGKLTHITTYGKSLVDCDQAADGGNLIKRALGWPKHLEAEPSRVSALKQEIKRLKDQVKELETSANRLYM